MVVTTDVAAPTIPKKIAGFKKKKGGGIMPFAGYTNFDDCVSKNQDRDDPQAYCGTIKRKVEESSENRYSLLLSSKITNAKVMNEGKGVKISGVALTQGTHNGVYYPGEEMQKATEGLKGRTLRLDHSKKLRDIVGRVDAVEFAELDGIPTILFEGTISDVTTKTKEVGQLVRGGLADSFSVGVEVDLQKEKGRVVAKDLLFKELSLVCDPADKNSKLIEILNSEQTENLVKKLLEENNMATKKLEDLPEDKQEVDKLPKATPQDDTPSAATADKTKAEAQDTDGKDVLKAEIARLKKVIADMQSAKPEAPKEMQDKDKKEEEKMSLTSKVEELTKIVEKISTRKAVMNTDSKPKLELSVENVGGRKVYTKLSDGSDPYGREYGVQR